MLTTNITDYWIKYIDPLVFGIIMSLIFLICMFTFLFLDNENTTGKVTCGVLMAISTFLNAINIYIYDKHLS